MLLFVVWDLGRVAGARNLRVKVLLVTYFLKCILDIFKVSRENKPVVAADFRFLAASSRCRRS
jgi:hypothetical protein